MSVTYIISELRELGLAVSLTYYLDNRQVLVADCSFLFLQVYILSEQKYMTTHPLTHLMQQTVLSLYHALPHSSRNKKHNISHSHIAQDLSLQHVIRKEVVEKKAFRYKGQPGKTNSNVLTHVVLKRRKIVPNPNLKLDCFEIFCYKNGSW